jgi:hypothetical protein
MRLQPIALNRSVGARASQLATRFSARELPAPDRKLGASGLVQCFDLPLWFKDFWRRAIHSRPLPHGNAALKLSPIR